MLSWFCIALFDILLAIPGQLPAADTAVISFTADTDWLSRCMHAMRTLHLREHQRLQAAHPRH